MGQQRQSQGQRRPRTTGQGQRQGQGRRTPQQHSGQRAPQRGPQQRRRPAGNQSPWGNLGNFRLPRLRPRGCLSGLAWTLVVVLVLAVAGTFWLDSRLNRVAADPPQHIAATSGTNWLLVGSDSRTGLSEADAQRLGTGGDIGSMRTDTIMLLHIPLTGKATLVSLPRDTDIMVDVRFLPNPFWIPELRPFRGVDKPVSDYVLSAAAAQEFLDNFYKMLMDMREGFKHEGKKFITVSIGCTGGHHRSVAIAEELARRLAVNDDLDVTVSHRDINRH